VNLRQPEEETTMSEDTLVPIYQTTDVGRAEIIKGALEGQGIRCSLENEHQAALSGVLQCRLLVRQEDETLARDFIEAHEPVHG